MRRGDRVVDGTGLENRRGETHRGFESLLLRHMCICIISPGLAWRFLFPGVFQRPYLDPIPLVLHTF